MNISRIPACSLLALALFLSHNAYAAAVAGDVLLAVGPVWVEVGGKRLPLNRGQQIEVGQKLITQEGGHVHVRMKDGGLVAVRPNSELEIQVFDYEPANPKAGKVRYSLRQGVARSVTGAIGEANKEAFRFNTPVAAIGVRGTDFVASSDVAATRVSVKSGAIVVAALSDICKAEGFGACLEHAVALRAGDDKSYVEVSQQDRTPRLLQGNQLLLPDNTSPPLQAEPVAVLQENHVATTVVATAATNPSLPGVPSTPVVTPPGQTVPATPTTGNGLEDVYWGRWKADAQGITGATVEELLAAGKSIQAISTVFGLGVTAMTTRLPENWQATFQLTGGDAYVASNGIYSPAALGSGSLTINVATRNFSATASVIEGGTTHGINAAGNVNMRGYLISDASKSDTSFFGVVHENLNTVGSTFDKSLVDGRSLTGTMIWHR